MPRPDAWPYRDYVIRAFNRDTPFPRFVREQLAGDTLPATDGSDWLTQAATGFLVGGTHDIVGNQTIEGMLQQRADDLDDMITATGTTFLGLTSSARGATTTSSTRSPSAIITASRRSSPGSTTASARSTAPDADARRREAAAIAAELAADRTAARRVRAAGQARSRCADPADGQPAAECRAVRAGEGPDGPPHDPGDQRSDRALHRRAGGLYGRRPGASRSTPRNVALASAGGKASASSEYPGRGDPQDRCT